MTESAGGASSDAPLPKGVSHSTSLPHAYLQATRRPRAAAGASHPAHLDPRRRALRSVSQPAALTCVRSLPLPALRCVPQSQDLPEPQPRRLAAPHAASCLRSRRPSAIATTPALAAPALVAWQGDVFAGYVTVVWRSNYPPFLAAEIPEIADFNVLPHLRRRGIGSRLLDEAERRIAGRSQTCGIAVGLDRDYGAAQRLYVRRGYVPDGRGIWSHGLQVQWGETVLVDDQLVLYFTKRLQG